MLVNKSNLKHFKLFLCRFFIVTRLNVFKFLTYHLFLNNFYLDFLPEIRPVHNEIFWKIITYSNLIPCFTTSSVSGDNINLLKNFLNVLPPRKNAVEQEELMQKPVMFQVCKKLIYLISQKKNYEIFICSRLYYNFLSAFWW